MSKLSFVNNFSYSLNSVYVSLSGFNGSDGYKDYWLLVA